MKFGHHMDGDDLKVDLGGQGHCRKIDMGTVIIYRTTVHIMYILSKKKQVGSRQHQVASFSGVHCYVIFNSVMAAISSAYIVHHTKALSFRCEINCSEKNFFTYYEPKVGS